MISFKRYIDIVSGVGAAVQVATRDLILRLFTSSPLVPSDGVVEISNADDVATYFGTGSAEHLRALFYFGFLTPLISRPKKISFGRWAATVDAPRIYGLTGNYQTSQFTGVTTGSIKLTIGAYTGDVTGVNLSTATTLSQVASLLQTAIRAVVAGGANWTAATVTYNATARRFELVGGATGAAAIATGDAATGVALRGLLGWGTGAVMSPGVAAEEPDVAFTRSANGNNNFGSFAFVSTALTTDQVVAVATANDVRNVEFIYSARTPVADAAALSAALIGLSGVGLTLAPLAGEFPELLPCALFASTRYEKRNSVYNYMYRQANLTPSVSDNSTADLMDGYRVNYYGQTQTAGRPLAFYQRGVMMGLATDPVDMNVYANEVWLKDAMAAAIMNHQLAMARVSANDNGRAQLQAVAESVVNQALFNGTISVGKPFNTTQKLYVTEMTGDDLAWHQVQDLGYWLEWVMESSVGAGGVTEWTAVYTLIYSKDDAVRKVEGTHALI